MTRYEFAMAISRMLDASRANPAMRGRRRAGPMGAAGATVPLVPLAGRPGRSRWRPGRRWSRGPVGPAGKMSEDEVRAICAKLLDEFRNELKDVKSDISYLEMT